MMGGGGDGRDCHFMGRNNISGGPEKTSLCFAFSMSLFSWPVHRDSTGNSEGVWLLSTYVKWAFASYRHQVDLLAFTLDIFFVLRVQHVMMASRFPMREWEWFLR